MTNTVKNSVYSQLNGFDFTQSCMIMTRPVCFMGGSVRCLTWTTDGTDANKLLEFAEQN